MPIMAKNTGCYRWLCHALLLLATFQIIVIYDTVRNRPKDDVVKDSSLARINGEIIRRPPPDKLKINDDNSENDESEEEEEKSGNNESENGALENHERGSDGDAKDTIDASTAILKGIESRQVFWLDETKFDMWKSDYYSGSWYIPIQRFDPVKAVEIATLEDGSHNVFGVNTKHARMSVDWLDLSVEHLSRWVRHFDMFNERHNDVAFNKITGNLMKYIQDTPEKTKALLSLNDDEAPLLHPTIALIPVGVDIDKSSELSRARSENFTAAMMGATVTSMMRAGFGRIVFVVADDDGKSAVQKTFEIVSQVYTDKADWTVDTRLVAVLADEELYKSSLVDRHMPRAAIYGLQRALRGEFNATYTTQWLGNDPSYWKYVYFSENDLVLQTRPASHPAIYNALEKEKVLFPHRLEPIPHSLDLTTEDGVVYDGTDRFLPAEGEFINILDLDGDVDMCCDGGNDRPTWDAKDDPGGIECADWFWNCGYNPDWSELGISEEIKHRRLLKYTPFMRQKQGIDIISISGSEHERKCHPRKRQTPSDVCEEPSKSGRSFATSEKQVE